MAVKEPPHRHNGGPLSDEMAEKLWGHVRALEILEEQAQDIRDDVKARKGIAKADGFDSNILAAILKRRKNGHGETLAADTLTRIYEEALQDEGVLPLEQTRITPEQRRRDVEEIGQTLHGQSAPPMPEREDGVRAAAENLDQRARVAGATITMSVGGEKLATFGAERPLFE
jgi:uncharacterized protein (UPF0335 family)